MKRRLLVPLVTAGVALASGVAAANPSYWRDNGLLLEVSADPRDGTDYVQTNPTRAGRLELVALVDAVRLRGLTVHFSDGPSFYQPMRTIRPGDRVMVDLPPSCGVIERVDLDYGRQLVDRTPARLQIIPHADRAYAVIQQRDHRHSYERPTSGYDRPTYRYERPAYRYEQPAYRYERPVRRYERPTSRHDEPVYRYERPSPHRTAPPYTVEPRSTWSGSIQGSFRF